MSFSDTDLVKIVKLLNLTTSTNDHEALSAVRKANALLKNHKILWDSLIGDKKKSFDTFFEDIKQDFDWQDHSYRDSWDKLWFNQCKSLDNYIDECIKGTTLSDLQNILLRSYKTKGKISEKQLATLTKRSVW